MQDFLNKHAATVWVCVVGLVLGVPALGVPARADDALPQTARVNFGIVHVSPAESWIITTEWMFNSIGPNRC